MSDAAAAGSGMNKGALDGTIFLHVNFSELAQPVVASVGGRRLFTVTTGGAQPRASAAWLDKALAAPATALLDRELLKHAYTLWHRLYEKPDDVDAGVLGRLMARLQRRVTGLLSPPAADSEAASSAAGGEALKVIIFFASHLVQAVDMNAASPPRAAAPQQRLLAEARVTALKALAMACHGLEASEYAALPHHKDRQALRELVYVTTIKAATYLAAGAGGSSSKDKDSNKQAAAAAPAAAAASSVVERAAIADLLHFLAICSIKPSGALLPRPAGAAQFEPLLAELAALASSRGGRQREAAALALLTDCMRRLLCRDQPPSGRTMASKTILYIKRLLVTKPSAATSSSKHKAQQNQQSQQSEQQQAAADTLFLVLTSAITELHEVDSAVVVLHSLGQQWASPRPASRKALLDLAAVTLSAADHPALALALGAQQLQAALADRDCNVRAKALGIMAGCTEALVWHWVQQRGHLLYDEAAQRFEQQQEERVKAAAAAAGSGGGGGGGGGDGGGAALPDGLARLLGVKDDEDMMVEWAWGRGLASNDDGGSGGGGGLRSPRRRRHCMPTLLSMSIQLLLDRTKTVRLKALAWLHTLLSYDDQQAAAGPAGVHMMDVDVDAMVVDDAEEAFRYLAMRDRLAKLKFSAFEMALPALADGMDAVGSKAPPAVGHDGGSEAGLPPQDDSHDAYVQRILKAMTDSGFELDKLLMPLMPQASWTAWQEPAAWPAAAAADPDDARLASPPGSTYSRRRERHAPPPAPSGYRHQQDALARAMLSGVSALPSPKAVTALYNAYCCSIVDAQDSLEGVEGICAALQGLPLAAQLKQRNMQELVTALAPGSGTHQLLAALFPPHQHGMGGPGREDQDHDQEQEQQQQQRPRMDLLQKLCTIFKIAWGLRDPLPLRRHGDAADTAEREMGMVLDALSRLLMSSAAAQALDPPPGLPHAGEQPDGRSLCRLDAALFWGLQLLQSFVFPSLHRHPALHQPPSSFCANLHPRPPPAPPASPKLACRLLRFLATHLRTLLGRSLHVVDLALQMLCACPGSGRHQAQLLETLLLGMGDKAAAAAAARRAFDAGALGPGDVGRERLEGHMQRIGLEYNRCVCAHLLLLSHMTANYERERAAFLEGLGALSTTAHDRHGEKPLPPRDGAAAAEAGSASEGLTAGARSTAAAGKTTKKGGRSGQKGGAAATTKEQAQQQQEEVKEQPGRAAAAQQFVEQLMLAGSAPACFAPALAQLATGTVPVAVPSAAAGACCALLLHPTAAAVPPYVRVLAASALTSLMTLSERLASEYTPLLVEVMERSGQMFGCYEEDYAARSLPDVAATCEAARVQCHLCHAVLPAVQHLVISNPTAHAALLGALGSLVVRLCRAQALDAALCDEVSETEDEGSSGDDDSAFDEALVAGDRPRARPARKPAPIRSSAAGCLRRDRRVLLLPAAWSYAAILCSRQLLLSQGDAYSVAAACLLSGIEQVRVDYECVLAELCDGSGKQRCAMLLGLFNGAEPGRRGELVRGDAWRGLAGEGDLSAEQLVLPALQLFLAGLLSSTAPSSSGGAAPPQQVGADVAAAPGGGATAAFGSTAGTTSHSQAQLLAASELLSVLRPGAAALEHLLLKLKALQQRGLCSVLAAGMSAAVVANLRAFVRQAALPAGGRQARHRQAAADDDDACLEREGSAAPWDGGSAGGGAAAAKAKGVQAQLESLLDALEAQHREQQAAASRKLPRVDAKRKRDVSVNGAAAGARASLPPPLPQRAGTTRQLASHAVLDDSSTSDEEDGDDEKDRNVVMAVQALSDELGDELDRQKEAVQQLESAATAAAAAAAKLGAPAAGPHAVAYVRRQRAGRKAQGHPAAAAACDGEGRGCGGKMAELLGLF